MTLALRLASTLLALSPAARNTSGTSPTGSMLTPGHPEPRTPSPRAGTLRSLSASALGVFQINWESSSLWRVRWHYTIGPGTILSSVFGSVRSSRRDNLCPSVCLSVTSALVWLEQSIFIFLTKIFNLFSRISLSSLSPNSQLSLGSLGILRWKDGAYNNSSCLLIYWPLIGSGWPHPT